jgi:outer membrane protein OmpA-like peptidoglycan-associated protein
VAPVTVQASKTNECDYRASGSSRADNVCKRILDDVALRLKNDPNASVVIVGFADPDEAQAAQLAQSRANLAQKYLTDSGIDATRVVVRVGQAETTPGTQNRRIDIVWVPKGATY